jgi:uncharacterized membrane protein YccF (DUF307 family)
MRLILNLIWFVLSGLWLALLYALFGLVLCVGIITIPFGVQLFKLAGYALWPFGREVVKSPGHTGLSTLGNILWLIPGLMLAISHVVTAFFCAVTVIGMPLAYANLKLIPMALTPFGREIAKSSTVTEALAAFRSVEATPASVTPGEPQLAPGRQPPDLP